MKNHLFSDSKKSSIFSDVSVASKSQDQYRPSGHDHPIVKHKEDHTTHTHTPPPPPKTEKNPRKNIHTHTHTKHHQEYITSLRVLMPKCQKQPQHRPPKPNRQKVLYQT